MAARAPSVLEAIGGTHLVELHRVVPQGCGRIVAKLEWENPTGSMKDRAALAMVTCAEKDGRLEPGDTVVEYTGGSTGVSLALICVAKGYRLRIVSSDAFSADKLHQMAAFGAEVLLVPSENGQTTRKLILDMIRTARSISREPQTYWTNQLENEDSIAGYTSLGEEIWSQSDQRVNAFVQTVGTAASIRGVGECLRRYDPAVEVIAVEPGESAVLAGRPAGPHKIEGVGIGYCPPLWDPELIDDLVAIDTEDAQAMARRLAREEGLFAGTSSGANVLAAIQVSRRLGPNSTVATLMVDSGLKYASTSLYRPTEPLPRLGSLP